jgi:ankyrin repeat protein
MTPLHYAALAEQKGCFMLLRSAGADPTCRSLDGQTAEELIPDTSWMI